MRELMSSCELAGATPHPDYLLIAYLYSHHAQTDWQPSLDV
jgi:hypothetical protein